jgi:hypothetical protein
VLYGEQDEVVWDPGAWWILRHVANPLDRPNFAILENNGVLLLKKYNMSVKWSSGAVSQC